MKNEKIIFSPGFTQTFVQLYDVYKMRYETAIELKRLSYTPEEMEGWAKALNDLKNSKLDMLSLSVVQAESFVYYTFLNPTNNKLIAIFGGQTNKPLSESIALNDENFERGLTVSCIIYDSGKMIHNWNCI